MINKRNFFKILSSAVLGTLMVGNCSNIWMMEESKFFIDISEEQKIKDELTSRIVKKIDEETHANVFLRTNFSVQLVDEIMKSKIEMTENTKKLICNHAVTGFKQYVKIQDIVDGIMCDYLTIQFGSFKI